MSKHTVNGVEISGAAIDVLYKLFFYGSQEDGDLPSKSGMSELIGLGWAVNNYNIPNVLLGEHPNSLSITGMKVAREYYRKERIEWQDDLSARARKIADLQSAVAMLAYVNSVIEQARPAYVELTNSVEFADNGAASYVASQDVMSKFDCLFDGVEKVEPASAPSYDSIGWVWVFPDGTRSESLFKTEKIANESCSHMFLGKAEPVFTVAPVSDKPKLENIHLWVDRNDPDAIIKSYDTEWLQSAVANMKQDILTLRALISPEQKKPYVFVSEDVSLQNQEFSVYTYHSSKPGLLRIREDGVAVLHKPTGIEAKSHSERSQHANRQKAIDELIVTLKARYSVV